MLGLIVSTDTATMLGNILPLLLLGAVFVYLMIIMPRKREKQTKTMQSAIKPGDRITTIGGLYGTVVSAQSDTLTIAIGPSGKAEDKAQLVVARWAVRGVEGVAVENDVQPE